MAARDNSVYPYILINPTYGTDAPMLDPRPQLGWVAFANISVEDKKLILGGNMRRIADRCFTK